MIYQYIDDKHLPDPNNMFEAKFDGIDSFETIGGISYQIKHVKINWYCFFSQNLTTFAKE